jgi:hypothetical protein
MLIPTTAARTLRPRIAVNPTGCHALAAALAGHGVPVGVLLELALEALVHVLTLLALALARAVVKSPQARERGSVPARAPTLHVLLQQQVFHLLLQ